MAAGPPRRCPCRCRAARAGEQCETGLVECTPGRRLHSCAGGGDGLHRGAGSSGVGEHVDEDLPAGLEVREQVRCVVGAVAAAAVVWSRSPSALDSRNPQPAPAMTPWPMSSSCLSGSAPALSSMAHARPPTSPAPRPAPAAAFAETPEPRTTTGERDRHLGASPRGARSRGEVRSGLSAQGLSSASSISGHRTRSASTYARMRGDGSPSSPDSIWSISGFVLSPCRRIVGRALAFPDGQVVTHA